MQIFSLAIAVVAWATEAGSPYGPDPKEVEKQREALDLVGLSAIAASTAAPLELDERDLPLCEEKRRKPLLPVSCTVINVTQPDGSFGVPREAFLIPNGKNGVLATCLAGDDFGRFMNVLADELNDDRTDGCGNESSNESDTSEILVATNVTSDHCLRVCATACDHDASCELAFYDYDTGECVGFYGHDGFVPSQLSNLTLFDCTQDDRRFCSRELPTFSADNKTRHAWQFEEKTWVTTMCPFAKAGATCDPCRVGTELTPFLELFPAAHHDLTWTKRKSLGLYCRIADAPDDSGAEYLTCFESRPLLNRPRCDPAKAIRETLPDALGGWIFPSWDRGSCFASAKRYQEALLIEREQYRAELGNGTAETS